MAIETGEVRKIMYDLELSRLSVKEAGIKINKIYSEKIKGVKKISEFCGLLNEEEEVLVRLDQITEVRAKSCRLSPCLY